MFWPCLSNIHTLMSLWGWVNRIDEATHYLIVKISNVLIFIKSLVQRYWKIKKTKYKSTLYTRLLWSETSLDLPQWGIQTISVWPFCGDFTGKIHNYEYMICQKVPKCYLTNTLNVLKQNLGSHFLLCLADFFFFVCVVPLRHSFPFSYMAEN